MEYNYERNFQATKRSDGHRPQSETGMCWHPVSTGRSYYNSLNQLVIEMERQEDKENGNMYSIRTSCLFFHSRRPGKTSIISISQPLHYVDEDRMVIICHRQTLLNIQATERQLGVQLYFDETRLPTDV